jgi:hypothetical protein
VKVRKKNYYRYVGFKRSFRAMLHSVVVKEKRDIDKWEKEGEFGRRGPGHN